jgi:hypothetical protein
MPESTDSPVTSEIKQPDPSIRKLPPTKPTASSTSLKNPPKTAPSTATILATARQVTQTMAMRDQKETKPRINHIESALNRAFKPQKEPPGVRAC